MTGHEFERVDLVEAGYVLVCGCAWRSDPSRSAEAVGDAWDRHRGAADVARRVGDMKPPGGG